MYRSTGLAAARNAVQWLRPERRPWHPATQPDWSRRLPVLWREHAMRIALLLLVMACIPVTGMAADDDILSPAHPVLGAGSTLVAILLLLYRVWTLRPDSPRETARLRPARQ